MERNVKHLLLRKTDVAKEKREKIWRNSITLKNKKVQGIFGGTFILALLSSAVFFLKKLASDFF